ncbi:hypothetical protein E2C01_033723 [Portunus trituberculatus]|uniref:Uncharacterized protein n=1 Tax=Portunus trituberculatus TaxID=210409 RepID=A0A5B7F4U3_PORTR|nr:hypothetical protein [Portunus trituberculatus]
MRAENFVIRREATCFLVLLCSLVLYTRNRCFRIINVFSSLFLPAAAAASPCVRLMTACSSAAPFLPSCALFVRSSTQFLYFIIMDSLPLLLVCAI